MMWHDEDEDKDDKGGGSSQAGPPRGEGRGKMPRSAFFRARVLKCYNHDDFFVLLFHYQITWRSSPWGLYLWGPEISVGEPAQREKLGKREKTDDRIFINFTMKSILQMFNFIFPGFPVDLGTPGRCESSSSSFVIMFGHVQRVFHRFQENNKVHLPVGFLNWWWVDDVSVSVCVCVCVCRSIYFCTYNLTSS